MFAKKMENIKLISKIGGKTMENLLENEAFCIGMSLGVGLYQQRVIEAHRRREPLLIGDNLYYLQDGRERLQAVIDEICK